VKEAAEDIINKANVVDTAAVLKATATPTTAPAPVPAPQGYRMEVQKKTKTVVTAEMNFPLTQEEANNGRVQEALVAGTSDATGVPTSKIRISKVGGIEQPRERVSVRERERERERQLADVSTPIEFEFQSASSNPEQVDKLKRIVKVAAKEGAIVTQVKKQAAQKGVLTEALKKMIPELIVELATESIVVDVPVPVRITPSSSNDERNAGVEDKKSDNTAVIGGAAGGAIGGLVLVVMAYQLCKPKPPPPLQCQPLEQQPQQQPPVQQGQLEVKLEGEVPVALAVPFSS
jgi:hypothetical protein